MAKKITLKNKNGDVLCPHTAIEQVQGLKEALDEKLDGSGAIDVVGPVNIVGEGSSQSKLTFARSLSYVANTEGKLGIITNGQTLSSGYGVWFSNTGIEPGVYVGNTYNLGSSSVKWKTVYATTFNGTATAVADGCVSTSKIADTAITPAKIQTDIALNGTPSMTVEPTTSSPDKTIASVGLVKEVVNDLDIDTRNLLANSKSITTPVGTTNYTQTVVNVPIGCSIGDVFYFNCDEITNLQGDATQYTILLYDMVNKVSLSADGVITADNRVAKITAWSGADAGNVRLLLYAGLAVDTIGNQVKYTNCTFVKGDKPMLTWQAAPEDVQKQIDGIEVGGRNLFSTSTLTLGGIDGKIGTENTGANRVKSSNYIPFSGESITCKSWISGVRFFVCFYNSSKTIITSTWASNNSEWIESEAKVYPVPTNTAYIRMVLGKPDNSHFTTADFPNLKMKVERGNKATDWTPSPEDINTEISNAETRSKAHAEDYTNAEIDKIENGQTVAQKANSLYDDDSGTYKNWGEIDTAITRKIGDKFEDYATKSYVQGEISKQVAVPIASETEDGKVKLATPEDVTAVENDISAVNDSAKAVTPYTLKEYIASKNFATSGDISSAVTAAKTTIFFQVAQPAGGKDGDIWIKP